MNIVGKLSGLLFLFVFNGNNLLQAQGKTFEITGDVSGIADAEIIYLSFPEGNDSARVIDGKFIFKGTLVTPAVASLRVKYLNQPLNKMINIARDNFSFFLSYGLNKVTAQNTLGSAVVNGSKWQDAYLAYNNGITAIYHNAAAVNKAYDKLVRQKDVEGLKQMKPAVDSFRKIEEAFVTKYLRENAGSPVTVFAVTRFARPIVNGYDFENAYELLTPELKASVEGKDLYKRIQDKKRFGIGVLLPDFAQPDTTGTMVHLSDFRGKYVFVDLWASWCGPCRQQIPFVKRADSLFKNKNFIVLAVSLDASREKWLKAIYADESTAMIHVGDMKDRKNEVALLYNIHSIPQNFLLNPEGRVIGRNLHDLELEHKLKEIFN